MTFMDILSMSSDRDLRTSMETPFFSVDEVSLSMDVDYPRMACNSMIFQQGSMRGKSDGCCRVNFTIFSFITVYSPGSIYYIGQAGVFDDRFARWQVYRTSSKPVRTYTSRTHSFGRVPQCVLGSQIFIEH